MSELNKLREEVQRRKKENEVERKQFEEKMVEMEKIVEGLKSRIKNLESTLRQNEVEYRNDLQKNQVNHTVQLLVHNSFQNFELEIIVIFQQDLEAKEKEIQLFKTEIKSLQDIVDRQKNTETKKVTEVSSKITDYQARDPRISKSDRSGPRFLFFLVLVRCDPRTRIEPIEFSPWIPVSSKTCKR